MATIGVDCMVILDGQGYWIEPAEYVVSRPRVHTATINRTIAAGGGGVGENFFDMGPAKRQFQFIVLALNGMRDYTGNFITTTGQQYHDALVTSYQKVNTTLSFTDPSGVTYTVHFLDLVEHIEDVRAQSVSELGYNLHVTLTEA